MASKLPDRRSLRLPGYDYSEPNTFFITICAHERNCFFGQVVGNTMELNSLGRAVKECWIQIPRHFPRVTLDGFVVMPNHIHGVINIEGKERNEISVGANNHSPARRDFSSFDSKASSSIKGTSRTIGSIVRGFKIGVTKRVKENSDIFPVWQRNYYEHVVRTEEELNEIREYIVANPLNWEKDDEYKT